MIAPVTHMWKTTLLRHTAGKPTSIVSSVSRLFLNLSAGSISVLANFNSDAEHISIIRSGILFELETTMGYNLAERRGAFWLTLSCIFVHFQLIGDAIGEHGLHLNISLLPIGVHLRFEWSAVTVLVQTL